MLIKADCITFFVFKTAHRVQSLVRTSSTPGNSEKERTVMSQALALTPKALEKSFYSAPDAGMKI